jgi:hypothetical protein
MRKDEARYILDKCGIARDSDFHALPGVQVTALMNWADLARYREPKNANGSRARYFHAMLQRKARSNA